jgi:hypothetical protein
LRGAPGRKGKKPAAAQIPFDTDRHFAYTAARKKYFRRWLRQGLYYGAIPRG